MKEISKLSLLLPLALLIAAVVQDMNMLSTSEHSLTSIYIREYFVIFSLILSFPLVYKQKWASDRNVLRGLRSLFFLILFTCFLLILSNDRLDSFSDFDLDKNILYENIANYIFVLSWTFFSTIFILITLGTLRNLIYIKRKKSTARNFTWLMIFLVIYPLFNMPESFKYMNWVNNDNFEKLHYVILFIIINLMVINSFRVAWINYLNRKQKLACFWGGLLLIPIQLYFGYKFHSINPVEIFSPVLGKFVDTSIIFLTIYIVVAFLALLAHLPTAQLYDRKIRQISSLHHLSRAVSSEFDIEKLVVTIVKLTKEVTESDFSWLELEDFTTKQINLVSSINLREGEMRTRVPSADDPLAAWLKTNKEPFLNNQTSKSQVVKNLCKWKKDLNSLLVLPLIKGEDVIGFLYAGKKVEFGFEYDDADMLRAFCEQAVVAIENTRLVEESIIKERLEQELKIAHEAQMKLLPKDMPELKNVEMDAVCITANEVGGDYYDFFEIDPDRLGVVIGDVSGKGTSAAFYMAEVKGIMEALAKANQTPKNLLIPTNETLYRNFDRKTFISLIYGIIDTKNKNFIFCRAGHCPVLMASPGEDNCKLLEPKGMGIGLDAGNLFERSLQQLKMPLKTGYVYLLYTDGLTEARNKTGEEFGEERLSKAFTSVKDLSAHEIKKRIIHDIYTFFDGENATDDMTFLIIKGL
ncbi:SpoIIE family protein phosphatase [candidate division KSB1 bacterium]|nr:SpoIIE family protein phosphatase [candidate division KSB1 bacterium]